MVNQIFKHLDLFPNDKIVEPVVYENRATVKGIILDDFNRVVLVSAKGSGVYFLPGGGVEEGEEAEMTLGREVMEEVGCDIKIIKKFASTEEYRDRIKALYKTECFLARVSKDEDDSHFIPEDSLFGPENIWVPRAEAIDIFGKQLKEKKGEDPAHCYNRKFSSTRDLFFVSKSMNVEF